VLTFRFLNEKTLDKLEFNMNVNKV